MPLPIVAGEPLSIPAQAFNEDGLAVVMLSGGRYGGDWAIAASTDPEHVIGKFETEVDERRKATLQNDPGYPDRAIETAFIWLTGETKRQAMRVVSFECFNSQYGPSERPYFCLARAIVASARFAPAPGVTYADEMTLDAVMGYSR